MSEKSKGLDLPKDVAKFLVMHGNPKYLAYVFGMHGMYVENVTQLYPKKDHANAQFNQPTIVMVRFDKDEQINLLCKNADPRLRVLRIFKSCWRRDKPDLNQKMTGFIYNCAKNALHLFHGKTFRIHCKEDPELQKQFYEGFVKLNAEEKTECNFDYDEYDIVFWIKKYKATDNKVWIVTAILQFHKPGVPFGRCDGVIERVEPIGMIEKPDVA